MINQLKNIFSKKPILITCIGFLVLGPVNSFSKSKMDLLTSDKAAKKAGSQNTIPAYSRRKDHAIGIGLGQTFLHGEFSDNGDDKITADLFYSYRASHSFDFFTDIHFSKHKYKNKNTKLSGVALGIKAKIYQIDAFSPFALGGLGFYRPILTRELDGVLTESISKVAFGYHIGAGADLKLNDRVTVGILAHYHNPFDVQQEDQASDVEGSYFKLLITGLYYF